MTTKTSSKKKTSAKSAREKAAKTPRRVAAPTNKQRIFDSALKLFGKQGFTATTIRQIGKHAGVAPSLLYRHFRDKDQLRSALDNMVLEELEIIFARLAEDTDMVDAVPHYFQTTRKLFNYVARSLLEPNANSVKFQSLYFDGIKHMYSLGQKKGAIRDDLDINQLALLGLVDTFGIILFEPLVKEIYRKSPGDPSLEKMRRDFFDEIWSGGVAGDTND